MMSSRGQRSRPPSAEIYEVYDLARQVDFPQINIDLIAGMSGKQKRSGGMWSVALSSYNPTPVTIYQMELPYNTVISQEIIHQGVASPIADWPTKQRWLDYAFEEFQARGYRIAQRLHTGHNRKALPVYLHRRSLARCDMIGLGVSSFSHFGGVPLPERS